MIWTALFSNGIVKTFSTMLNDIEEAKTTAGAMAKTYEQTVIAVIKGNCEKSTYFI
jgi:hypothetical protein